MNDASIIEKGITIYILDKGSNSVRVTGLFEQLICQKSRWQ